MICDSELGRIHIVAGGGAAYTSAKIITERTDWRWHQARVCRKEGQARIGCVMKADRHRNLLHHVLSLMRGARGVAYGRYMLRKEYENNG